MSNFLRNFLRKHNSLGYKLFMTLGIHQGGEFTFITQLSSYMNNPYTTINYWITKFKEEGLIINHLELSDKGKKLFKILWNNAGITKLRAHNIQVVFFLSKCPEDFVERYSSDIFSLITNGRYRGLIGKIFDVTCMIYSTKKKVVILRIYFGETIKNISFVLRI